jgi:hypothetical protein
MNRSNIGSKSTSASGSIPQPTPPKQREIASGWSPDLPSQAPTSSSCLSTSLLLRVVTEIDDHKLDSDNAVDLQALLTLQRSSGADRGSGWMYGSEGRHSIKILAHISRGIRLDGQEKDLPHAVSVRVIALNETLNVRISQATT